MPEKEQKVIMLKNFLKGFKIEDKSLFDKLAASLDVI